MCSLWLTLTTSADKYCQMVTLNDRKSIHLPLILAEKISQKLVSILLVYRHCQDFPGKIKIRFINKNQALKRNKAESIKSVFTPCFVLFR